MLDLDGNVKEIVGREAPSEMEVTIGADGFSYTRAGDEEGSYQARPRRVLRSATRPDDDAAPASRHTHAEGAPPEWRDPFRVDGHWAGVDCALGRPGGIVLPAVETDSLEAAWPMSTFMPPVKVTR